MSTDLKHIPILNIDIEDFGIKSTPEQRSILQHLQKAVTVAARFFMPYGDVWKKWRRHGTGDGYYFLLDGLSPHIALKYALNLIEELDAYNKNAGRDLSLRLRMALVIGDVELIEDQYLSKAFTEAERFLSHPPFKTYLKVKMDLACVLAMSSLFHAEWLYDPKRNERTLRTGDLKWTSFSFRDKHDLAYSGYVLGDGWHETEETAVKAPALPPRFRITILAGHSLDEPLPEAVEMVKATVREWKASGLYVEIRVDTATLANLRRESHRGCDLFIYYGHGDKEGRLFFAEGPHNSNQMGVEDFWKGLSACIIFACYGMLFSNELPCPWIAFSAPILRQAPRGFMSAWIKCLQETDLHTAAGKALTICGRDMHSNFTDICQRSDKPLPEIRIGRGEPCLSRLSPGLSNRLVLDYPIISMHKIPYPEHAPFVGRTDILKSLIQLPGLYGDENRQRILWVSGDAGMGKSALLRQFTLIVCDLIFYEKDEPVYLFQMNCWNFTNPLDLEKEMITRLKNLYHFAATYDSLREFIRGLEDTRGSHVWILDDLTYMGINIESNEEAAKFIVGIAEAAKSSALSLQLVVSSRRPGPAHHRWEKIEVPPLSLWDARRLALAVLPTDRDRKETDLAEIILGADMLFQYTHRSTAIYKRSLMLAVDSGLTYRAYADQMRKTGSLEVLGAVEFAGRMVEFEAQQLKGLETSHGFRYARFLEIYYPLINRCGWFTKAELKEWFGRDFVVDTERVSEEMAYENGLHYLLRLNLLAADNREAGDITFYMPPNQRLSMRAIRNRKCELPAAIPLRGIKERLSLGMERIKKGDWTSVEDLLEMEHDYKSEIEKPEAGRAVLQAMNIRAEVEYEFQDKHKAIKISDEIVSLFDMHRLEYASYLPVVEQVVKALVNKSARLAWIGQTDEAIAVCDDLVARFGSSEEMAIAEKVSSALYNKSVTMRKTGRSDEAIIICDDLVARFGNRKETPIAEKVAMALFHKGITLGRMGRFDDEIAVYDDIVVRFGNRKETPIAEKVADALANKVFRLRQIGRSDEEISVYDDLVDRFGRREEISIAEKVASALFNKGNSLGKMGRSHEEIAVYDDLVARFGSREETSIAEKVASALVNKGATLAQMGRSDEESAVYDDLVARFGSREETPIAEKVALALANKGVRLGQIGRSNEEIAVYDDLVTRFGGREETSIAEQVAKALINKGIRLGHIGRSDEEIAVYDDLVTRFGNREETPLEEMVAKAMFNKGARLGQMGRSDEEVAIYDELVAQFGSREQIPIAEQVAKAMYNKGFRLGQMGQPGEEITVYDKLLARFENRDETPITETLISALLNKGARLWQMGRLDEEISVYDDLVSRFGSREETSIAEQVAKALINKVFRLGQMGRSGEVIAVYDDIVERFGSREETPIAEHVAKALVSKGVGLGQMGRLDEEIAVYDNLVARYGSREETPIAEQVVKALVNKSARLGQMGRSDEAIAVYDDIVERYGSREETPIVEIVAAALYSKGIILGRIGRSDEEIAVYDDLVARYGCREETSIAEKVGRAMVSKGITMVQMGQSDEAIALLKNVINKFASHQDPEIVKAITVAAELTDAMNIQKQAGGGKKTKKKRHKGTRKR
jgi:tetratricopeptide (TPR) repeat protein